MCDHLPVNATLNKDKSELRIFILLVSFKMLPDCNCLLD